MKLIILDESDARQIHFVSKDICIASQGLMIQSANCHFVNWKKINEISSSFTRKWQNYCSLFARLVRGGIHSIIPICSNGKRWVVVAEGKLYLLDVELRTLRHFFIIPRGRRPLRRGLCVVKDNVLIGEYWGNPERNSVNIYRVNCSSGKIEKYYCFPAKTVRHIHTVEKDPFTNQIWVSTGDNDDECKIVLLNADSGEEMILGEGSQKWRTLSFAFRAEAVYWGTDNHLGKNEIWRFVRCTGAIKKVGNVVGPVYYNTCLNDAIIFGTTMEKGEGEQDGYGRLYAVDHRDNITEVWKLKKDHWSARLFGYGVFEFAEGATWSKTFWVTAKGLNGGLRSILFELNDE